LNQTRTQTASQIGRLFLGFDTCGASGSVTVARATPASGAEIEVLGERALAGRSYSAQLMAAIADLLAEAGAKPADLAGIAVMAGPGSFTGVRVGLSTAKGLAQGAEVPVLAVSRLKALAAKAGAPRVLALLDAGRGEFYAGEYRDGMCIREMLLRPDEVEAAAGGLRLAVCEASVAERLGRLRPLETAPPGAVDAIRSGLADWHGGRCADLATLDANYLRRSDAELFARSTVPAE
jgi:tRNA threonylcarbamoyladenosine biosynthesis protein TsaB